MTRINVIKHARPVLNAYRNHSIDLYIKSIDWFLHDWNTDIK